MQSEIDESTPRAIALDRYAFIAIEGAKARDFLQGQLSCNLEDAGPSVAIPGACCTPKGRVIANFLLWQQNAERILLRLNAEILEETAAVLRKYGVFSRVNIAPAEPPLSVIALLGRGLDLALAESLPAWPRVTRQLLANDDALLLQRDEKGTVFELWVRASERQRWLQRIGASVAEATHQDWSLALVRNGAAEIHAATREMFLPQMLAYDRSGAVHFRKGCYTGQEIVARAHYKGQVKRQLRRFEARCTVLPEAGCEIRSADERRPLATVVESAPTGTNQCELLVVIADDMIGGETRGECHGAEIALKSALLPYVMI